MNPETDLSQFHHCDSCGAKDQNKRVNDVFNETYDRLQKESGLSPRQGMMVLSSLVCELSAAQQNPAAALDEAIATIKKLFERGEEEKPPKKPAFNPNVH